MAKLSESMVMALTAAKEPGTTIKLSAHMLRGYRDGHVVSLDSRGRVTKATLEALHLRGYLTRTPDGYYQITTDGLNALP